MPHLPPPDPAERFVVLIMRPADRDRFGINRPGIGVAKAVLERRQVACAVLDGSEATAPAQLLDWLRTGRVSFVYAQGGWGARIHVGVGEEHRSIFDHFGTPFLARITVPPFNASVVDPMTAPIARKTILLSDTDAVAFTRQIPVVRGRILPFPSVFAGFAGGPQTPPGERAERRFRGLVVARIDPPSAVRARWRALYPDRAGFLDSLAERAIVEVGRPFPEIVSSAVEDAGFDLWSAGGDAFTMLNLVNMYAISHQKLEMLRRAARYPFRFVIDGDLSGIVFHDRAEISGGVPASELQPLHAASHAAVSCNPNNMSGAVSERIPIALRAGAAVVHARNALLHRHFRPGEDYLEFDHGDRSLDAALDAVAGGTDLAGMNARMRPRFERLFGPEAMIDRLLQVAEDGDS